MENQVHLRIKRDQMIAIRLVVSVAFAVGLALGLVIGGGFARWYAESVETSAGRLPIQISNFESRAEALAYRLWIWHTLTKLLQEQIEAAERAENGPYLPQDAPGGAK
jgi:hypothetical protein